MQLILYLVQEVEQQTIVDYKLSSKYFLKNGITLDQNIGFPSPYGGFEHGHIGDGFAKITILIPYIATIQKCSNQRINIIMFITILLYSN